MKYLDLHAKAKKEHNQGKAMEMAYKLLDHLHSLDNSIKIEPPQKYRHGGVARIRSWGPERPDGYPNYPDRLKHLSEMEAKELK